MNFLADEQEDSMPIAKPVTNTLKTKNKKTKNKKTGNTVLQLCSSSKTNLKIRKESKSILKIDNQNKTEEDSCCYGPTEECRVCNDSIFVKGFQHLRPREEIKKELSNIFGSYGKVMSVFVPMQCGTCVPLGFAFINIQEGGENALKLNGSYVEGRKLVVKMANCSEEYFGFPPTFTGCHLCLGLNKRKLRARKPLDYDKALAECYHR